MQERPRKTPVFLSLWTNFTRIEARRRSAPRCPQASTRPSLVQRSSCDGDRRDDNDGEVRCEDEAEETEEHENPHYGSEAGAEDAKMMNDHTCHC